MAVRPTFPYTKDTVYGYGEIVAFEFRGRWRIGWVKSAEYDSEGYSYTLKAPPDETFIGQKDLKRLKSVFQPYEMKYIVRHCK